MRVHHTPRPSSCGCAALITGQAATPAAIGPRIIPKPRPNGQRIGSTASAAISKAPPNAMTGTTSMPATQAAVAVERAIERVSRRTRTADHTRPPRIDDRAPDHSCPGVPRTRALSDADCISGPHESGEGVAAWHHIQVLLLTKIEARILVWAAEARDVEGEHDELRGAAMARRDSLRILSQASVWVREVRPSAWATSR